MRACCATKNLGPRARRAQLRAGVLWLGLSLVAGLILVELGLAARFGWVLLLPMLAGCYAMMAGLTGVCVLACARGGRVTDYGFEAVADGTQRLGHRLRGAGVLLASLCWAVFSTAVFVASA